MGLLLGFHAGFQPLQNRKLLPDSEDGDNGSRDCEEGRKPHFAALGRAIAGR